MNTIHHNIDTIQVVSRVHDSRRFVFPGLMVLFRPQVRRGVVDCEENPCVRMPCGEGGSCAVVRDQGFQCRCKADFTGESDMMT